jgi:hypothetical protein
MIFEDYSVGFSGVAGDEVDLSAEVSGGSGGLSYSWRLEDSSGGVVEEGSGSSWSVAPDFDPDETYEAIVEVSDGSETVSRSQVLDPRALERSVSAPGRVSAEDDITFSFGGFGQADLEAVDRIEYTVERPDGSTVSGSVDSLDSEVSVDPVSDYEGLGDYTVSFDYVVGGEPRYSDQRSFEATPPSLVTTRSGEELLPRDLDGDGLYEDVRGDGRFNILDVASLWKNVYEDNPDLQKYAEAFYFMDDKEYNRNRDKVNVFDVQTLFGELEDS